MLGFPSLSGCQRAEQPAPVVYLADGTGGADSDAGLAKLRAALQERHPNRGGALRLDFSAAPTPWTPAVRAHIASWLSNPRAVIVAPTSALAAAVIAQPRAASLLFSSYSDPVRRGLVPNLVRPGSRTTGVSLADTWHAKRLDLLRDAFPRLRRVGVLLDRSMASTQPFELHFARPARALGLQALPVVADTLDQLHAALASSAALALDGWYIPATFVAYEYEREIIQALQRLQLPAIHSTQQEVAAGALMAYAPDTAFFWGTMAELCLRIRGGEDAGTIPIHRPRRFSLAVRPRDEPKPLRLAPTLIRRADRVF
jgi:ABC-type uncharacterized transport system substrate-binding protein